MDSNEYVEQNQQPIIEPPVMSTHVHLPRVFLVLCVAMFSGLIFGLIGYLLGLSSRSITLPETQQTSKTVINAHSTPALIISPSTTPSITSTQIDTGNWKTYANTAYNYLIKLPPSWTVTTFGRGDLNTFSAPSLLSPCNNDAGDTCSQVNDAVENRQNIIMPLLDGDHILSTSHIKVSGEVAKEWVENYPNLQSDPGRIPLLDVIVIIHNNQTYILTYS